MLNNKKITIMKKVTVMELFLESDHTPDYICRKLDIDYDKFYSDYVGNWGRMTINQFSLFANLLDVRAEDLYNIWQKEEQAKKNAFKQMFLDSEGNTIEEQLNGLKIDKNK